MKSNIVKALNILKSNDIMSLILFALYKVKDIPEYATLSELAYLLDEKSMNNFLEYYGGTTIKVPTKQEFILVISALLLYEYTKIYNMDFKQACEEIADSQHISVKDLRDTYLKLTKVLEKYDFKRN